MKKQAPNGVQWTFEHKAIFQSNPILRLLDLLLPFHLVSDKSNISIRACQMQKQLESSLNNVCQSKI